MFGGDAIMTEKRTVLHIALCAPATQKLVVGDVDGVAQVHAVFENMAAFADAWCSGRWLGIDIGGSDLGPVIALEPLRHYSQYRRQRRVEALSIHP